MLDPPTQNPYNQLNQSVAQSPENLAAAYTAAIKGMTLLQNNHDALPLSSDTFTSTGSLAVIGPQATMAGLLMGNYAESASHGNWGTDILDAITARVGRNTSVVYAAGCKDIPCSDDSGFADAARVAQNADAVIVTLGLDFDTLEREGHDRSVSVNWHIVLLGLPCSVWVTNIVQPGTWILIR